MRWISRPNRNCRNSLVVVSGTLVAASTGCYQYPDVFLDDLPQSAMVTTASAKAASDATVTPSDRRRQYAQVTIEAHDGTTAHAPLWLEDPFEMAGSDDGQFAVTGEEFLYFPYGMGRFVVNVLLLPVSIVLEPAYTVMCSDGVEGRTRWTGAYEPYDAERCIGVTTPADVHETWSFDETYAASQAKRTTSPNESESGGEAASEGESAPERS